ncbi:RTA1-domain-containing protein [Nadsonia fulvescens var. elongata DSM 6958]|uniref:Sphingoid long-chain base transporter RSB1 n=1 Tax=Nadsonia fulvescens var. elongata DSM 6958 TaxID=857566 RepID=A0A1E3PK67_9ASCO|nr:RTA1-domain-containing protein [Nadsonia fulvescens var. elongata DSM 6958]
MILPFGLCKRGALLSSLALLLLVAGVRPETVTAVPTTTGISPAEVTAWLTSVVAAVETGAKFDGIPTDIPLSMLPSRIPVNALPSSIIEQFNLESFQNQTIPTRYLSEEGQNPYGYVPNFGLNLAALICFAIIWLIQTALGAWYQQWWFGISWFIGCGLETGGYISRVVSHDDVTAINPFLVQIICLTLGPAFMMGGVYYIFGKLVIIWGEQYSKLKPMWYSILFIICDVISIVLQAIGGGMAAVAVQNRKDTKPGTHIMVGGLAFQVASMCVFIFLISDTLWKVYRAKKQNPDKENIFNPQYANIRQSKFFKPLIIAIICSIIAVFTRCVYRVVELAEGWSGYLISHEGYFLVLDALMMIIGGGFLSVIHPGYVLKRYKIRIRNRKNEEEFEDKNQNFEGASFN